MNNLIGNVRPTGPNKVMNDTPSPHFVIADLLAYTKCDYW